MAGRALVRRTKLGVCAEKAAKGKLKIACRRFLQEHEPSSKKQAGNDLIRAIFGKNAITEDPFL
jgi:hypothetical protein